VDSGAAKAGDPVKRFFSAIRHNGLMELALQIHVEQLPEGVYLATSGDLPGLVAQGRTVAETLEIARDVAKKLIEARREREGDSFIAAGSVGRDYTIVVAA
jgi:predicted RNase H-like HicB family nuclease